ncbi:beta-1,3-galactosyltransferase 6 [Drosophila grimshawi]|uniref:Hexosyltransferase n=1 Tax=Drosophila grimshawi TaxID=7222 RepID=B4JQ18_DROGR|nr:beta-1,3-galactosyltransferase 6 [Drosophila grimshawi]EDV98998.1 GH13293 [Drosophila grimshawi]
MRRLNNLVTLFTAITAFFFGSFITRILTMVDKCPAPRSGVAKLEPHPDLFLVILVFSAPSNVEMRDGMRDTWLRLGQPLRQAYFPEEYLYLPSYTAAGGHLQMETVAAQAHRLQQYMSWQQQLPDLEEPHIQRNIKVKHLFAIGTDGQMGATLRAELEHEQKQHKDLLLLPRLHDDYLNLTEKLMQSLDALTRHYEFSYLLKVDDDTYVKLDNLLNELVSYDRKLLRNRAEFGHEPLPELYWGYFNGRANIKVKGHWRETNYYLSKNYINYALGGGYLLSRKLCEHVANNSYLLSSYVSEDASLGTWLAPLRHVYRWHDVRFDTAYTPSKCRPYHMVLHKRNQRTMHDLYTGKLCTHEQQGQRLFVSYYYDWTKPADKCCDSIVA